MQEGAGGGDVDPAGEAEERGEGGQRLLVVVDPDVAAVDHAGDEPSAGESSGGREVVEVGRRGVGEVECQSVDRGPRQDGQGFPEPVEVGGDEQSGAIGEPAELRVGPGDGVEIGRGAVLDECGFVELHPLRPGRPQIGEDLGIDRKQTVQEGERLEVRGDAGRGLGEEQIGDRADEDGPGGQPQGDGLVEFGDLLRGVRGEDGVRAQFRNQVVVVGVEPLGHLQRCGLLRAARHREVPVEGIGGNRLAMAVRDGSHHDAGVQHMVVIGEVPGRDLVDAGLAQLPPGVAAQSGGGGAEGVRGDPPLPIAFDGLLQFPVLSLPGVAVHRGPRCRGRVFGGHGDLLREMNP